MAHNVGIGGAAQPGGRLRVTLALHAAVLLFGLAGLFGRWLALHPLLIVLGRTSVAAVTLALWLGLRRATAGSAAAGAAAVPAERGPTSTWHVSAQLVPPRQFLALGAVGGAVLALHWGAFFQAIQVSTLGLALVSYSTAPVFTALLEALVFRERLERHTAGAAVLSLGGAALLVPSWSLRAAPHDLAALQGVAWGMLAGASFGVLALLNRRLVVGRGAAQVALAENATAALLLAPLLPWIGQALTWSQAGQVLTLGVLCTALAHGLFIAALRRVRAGTAAVVSALEPVYGIALGALLLGETPALRTVLGGLVILGAVLSVTLSPDRAQAPRGAV